MYTILSGLLKTIMECIEIYKPSLLSAGVALSISVLMGFYDGQSLRKTIAGALVCGIVTLALTCSLRYLGMPSNAIMFGGVAIGLMGVDKVRYKITKFFEIRTGGKDGDEK